MTTCYLSVNVFGKEHKHCIIQIYLAATLSQNVSRNLKHTVLVVQVNTNSFLKDD